jgi:hypothetical protein
MWVVIVIEIHLSFFVKICDEQLICYWDSFWFFAKLCGEQLIDSFLNFYYQLDLEISWNYVMNWFIGSFEASQNLYCQLDLEIFWFWNFVKISGEQFIDSFLWVQLQTCTASLHSEIFWLLLWVFSWKFVVNSLFIQNFSNWFIWGFSWKYVVNLLIVELRKLNLYNQ